MWMPSRNVAAGASSKDWSARDEEGTSKMFTTKPTVLGNETGFEVFCGIDVAARRITPSR